MLSDLRDALRQLRKAPGFTTTAVITLALGIGAATAIFTLVHQVMLKSLPVAKPDELWRIGDKIRCCNWGGYTQGDKQRTISCRPIICNRALATCGQCNIARGLSSVYRTAYTMAFYHRCNKYLGIHSALGS